MNTKYFETRQNATKASEEEMEEIFKCIAGHFSHKWIKSPRSHPLQQLWNRRDVLATNELYIFGTCLQAMSATNSKWVKDQVKMIKGDHNNNRLGAFFEIIGLAMLNSPNHKIIPATNNNPGFDGTLLLSDTKTISVSLKNYGDSSHCMEFTGYGAKVEACIIKTIKEKKICGIQIIIDAVKAFPTKSDWDNLLNNIPHVLSNVEQGKSKAFGISDCWAFMYNDLKDEYQEFHSDFNSYQIIIFAPYQKNEEKNLISKLDDACIYLSKHSIAENECIINAVFIHLPESASIMKCKQWAEDYFLNFPGKPITSIIFYQPTIGTELDKNTNFIHHCFQISTIMDKYNRWNPELKKINFDVVFGIANYEAGSNKLIAEIEGERKVIDFNGRYVYQRGNLYLAGKQEADGSINGNINRIASGIFAHTVFQPFPGQPSFTFSGRFAPVDKLIIL